MTNGNKNAKQLYPGIICDLCDGPVCGRRYKCLICPDYDLCQECERTGYHGEHAMLRLATPQTEKPDFLLRSSSSKHPHPSYGYMQFLDPVQYGADRAEYYKREYTALLTERTEGGQKYIFDPESEQGKKPMSYEEKAALSNAIGELSSDRIKNVIDIITRSERIIGANPNDFEIVFETLKCETLRELEAFVKACTASKTSSQSANVQFPYRYYHVKHHRHHYSKGGCSKWERGNENEGGNGPAVAGNSNEDQTESDFIKWQQKMLHKIKMEKKCAKQEQHYRDRAFRALHHFGNHHRGHGQHRQPKEERKNVSPMKNNVGVGQQSNGVEYLKQIGHSLQQALLNFGIDCEATVKDHQGNVQSHLPFPYEQNLVPPQQNQNVENRLNPMERESPAGVLERQKLASENGIGKKRSTREIILAELKEAIQRADQITNDKMLRKQTDAGMEKKKEKKSEKKTSTDKSPQQPTPPPSAESQSPPSEPQQNNQQKPHSIDPSLQAVFQNATKAAIDGFQAASQIASEIISGFDPTASEHIKNLAQNLVDGAKNGAENLTDKMLSSPELLQQATAFQSYLEQLQFPPWMPQNYPQNPTQNAKPPTNENEGGNGQQFPPSPQMPEYIQNMITKIQEQMNKEMTNQQTQPAKMDEEKSKREEETKLSCHFSQMNLKEEKLAPAKELISEQKQQKEKEEEIVAKEKKDEEKVEIVGEGRKKEGSFSSSDSDVEILNGSDDEEEEGDGKHNLEIEPSLPPSFGSGHHSNSSSLKRKAPLDNHLVEMNKALYDSMNMEMELSTHTALSTLGGMGSSSTINQQQKENNVANNSARGLSSSRASSISSLHSTSSNSSSSTDSSGWMVVKRESFKRLYEFYEKRRRLDSPNGHGDSFIAELEKERQEALKQQQKENEMDDKIVENGQSNKFEEKNNEENHLEKIKNEEISVDVKMKKMQINEEEKSKLATNHPKVLEEKIVDIDESQEVKKELPKNNANGEMPSQTPEQSSNYPNANPLFADLSANLAGLMDVLMHGAKSQPPTTQPTPTQQSHQKVPAFKWNWGDSIPMPPPPQHFNTNSTEIPVFDNGQPKQPTKPMPSAPTAEMEINNGQEKKQHSNIYPDLLAASMAAAGNGVLNELCTAGEPHHHCLRMATTSRHTRQCRWIHPNPDVVEVTKQLTDMGFDNCNGWLYRLAEQHNCQLDSIFEAIEQDNLHKERQLLADI